MKNKNTYSLLINADAEEKGRSIFETTVYSFVVMATALSVWAFASGAVVTPGMGRPNGGNEAGFAIKAPVDQPIVLASRN
jgi:hypothetical protein